MLSPAVSYYPSRSFYVTYDITPLLRKGRNCVGLWLGRGWHVAGRLGVSVGGPMLRFQAEMVAGGKKVEIASDETWRGAPSPYGTLGPWYWDHYGGERYDARLDNPAWSSADYDDRQWAGVDVVAPPGCGAQPQSCPLNRIGMRIPAVACARLEKGRFEVDFGTNLSGWLRMRLPTLTAGQRIVIHYADRRYASDHSGRACRRAWTGAPATKPSRRPMEKSAIRRFIRPTSSFPPAGPTRSSARSSTTMAFATPLSRDCRRRPPWTISRPCSIESDLESVGSFACSNELLNRIYRLNLWTVRCLDLGGYLVDCPHRERLGYGDGQVSAETCLMNLRMPNFLHEMVGRLASRSGSEDGRPAARGAARSRGRRSCLGRPSGLAGLANVPLLRRPAGSGRML